ncbi:hypothetical protein NDN08_007302 [Rhodosorus marinus]|uniref:SHSP domain-containing protein n=1 Tax=Rhodosorus marinus TaxID=101924 RepID=A0AAV8UJ41_9RHOD|nr:hypothetical protein NDN08_007302 [Rhodosorus marinus]
MDQRTICVKRDKCFETNANKIMELDLFRLPMLFDSVRYGPRARMSQEETESGYTFTIVLAGVGREAVELKIVGNKLDIKAGKEDAKFQFDQRFALPKNAVHEEAKAVMSNGVLQITVPKQTEKAARDVIVQDSGEPGESDYKLAYQVPGASKDNVAVTVNGNTLVIKVTAENNQYFRNFSDDYRIPKDASADDIAAICRNGVLTVSVPKISPTSVAIEDSVEEEEGSFSTSIRVPGVSKEQISLNRVKHAFKMIVEDSQRQYEYSFYTPGQVDVEKVRAGLKNGILTISAPRVAEVEYVIPVESA